MSKRGADRQLTKDDASSSDDDNTQGDGRWKEADTQTLQQRKIVTVKRKTTSASGAAASSTSEDKPKSAFPTFSFGSVPSASTTAASNSTSTSTSAAADTSTVTDGKSSTTTVSSDTATMAPAASNTSDTAADTNSVWSKFALKADEWKCPTCDITNKNTSAKCPACDTDNPNAVKADTTNTTMQADQPKFTFGVAPSNSVSTNSSTTAGTPPFSFGSTTPFTFGGTTPSLSTAGFAFGNTSSSGTSGFTFGSTLSAANTGDEQQSNGQYKFSNTGSDDGGSGELNFAGGAETGLVTETGTTAEFQGKSAEASGEENDTILCKQRTRCYKMATVEKVAETRTDSKDDNQLSGATKGDGDDSKKAVDEQQSETRWLQIGEGELHVNLLPPTDGKVSKARFVLRTDKTQRLVLNSSILTHTPIRLQSDKYIHFKSTDLDGQFHLFLLKFKSRGEAQDVLAAVEQAKKQLAE